MTSAVSGPAPVIVALDFDNKSATLALVDLLDPGLCRVKVGKELFTREGPQLVSLLVDRGFDVFLDLKFHDIPNTVAGAVAAAADLGVWMVNVHTLGGTRMMEAAANRLQAMGAPTLLIGVTVLTSMGAEDLHQIGIAETPENQVARLANLAYQSGLNGIVCSAHEAGSIAYRFGETFLRVTPGIRPLSSARDDQVRVMTPRKAIEAGSSHLVVGRPITTSENPGEALLAIVAEVRDH